MANLRFKIIALCLSMALINPYFATAATRNSQKGSSCQDILNIAGFLLATETQDKPTERTLFGFMMPNEKYYGENGRVLRSIKDTYQFIPRRVIGAIRGERGHFYDCVHGDPSYSFTVMHGIQTCFADLPVYGVTSIPKVREKLGLSKMYGASFVLSVFLTAAPFYYAIIKPQMAANTALVNHEEQKQISDFLDYYLSALKYDPRFSNIKSQSASQMTASPKRFKEILRSTLLTTLWVDESNKSFISQFSVKDFKGNPEEVLDLVRYPQFQHLVDYAAPPADPNQLTNYALIWKEIVQREWIFHLSIDEIGLAYQDPAASQRKLAPLAELSLSLANFVNSDFGQLLRRLEHEGKFTTAQAISLLKENFYYRARVEEAKQLSKFKPLKMELPENFSWEQFEAELIQDALKSPERWQLPGGESLWRDKGIWK